MCYTNLAAGPLAAGSRPAAFICWCVGASISEERTLPPPNILCRANAMAEAAQPQGFLSPSGVFDMKESAGALSAVGMPFARGKQGASALPSLLSDLYCARGFPVDAQKRKVIFTNQQGMHGLHFCKAIFRAALLHTCAEPLRDIYGPEPGVMLTSHAVYDCWPRRQDLDIW